MSKMLIMTVAVLALTSFEAASALAAKKQPAVQSSASCKPSNSGKVYRNYQNCVEINTRLGWGSNSLSRYCGRFCSQ